MKLYYYPGACSLSPHIALCETELNHDLVRVDFQAGKTEDGRDYSRINPFGYVPALELDNGDVLLEGPAIVQYIADRVPRKRLAPPNGSIERYRLQQYLNFISTELHKSLGALFNPALPEGGRELFAGMASQRLDRLVPQLEGNQFIMGDTFTVADAYLFTVLSWSPHLNFDLSPWPMLGGYLQRVGSRPAVRQALKAEGLLQE